MHTGVIEITSKENPAYKELKRLTANEDKNCVLIEGKKLLFEAISSLLKITKVYVDKNSWNKFSDLFVNSRDFELIYMTNDLLSSVFTTDNKPEYEDLIVAVAEKPLWNQDDLLKSKRNIVFFENIQDPGNLGTSIRSALAFDSGGVILSGGSVNPFNTKVIRASAGAVFTIPVLVLDDQKLFFDHVKKENYKIIATASERSNKNLKLQLDKLSVFLFGNEGKGLSGDLIEYVDEVVSVPQSGKVESLNLATSVSLILWEVYRQKMCHE